MNADDVAAYRAGWVEGFVQVAGVAPHREAPYPGISFELVETARHFGQAAGRLYAAQSDGQADA